MKRLLLILLVAFTGCMTPQKARNAEFDAQLKCESHTACVTEDWDRPGVTYWLVGNNWEGFDMHRMCDRCGMEDSYYYQPGWDKPAYGAGFMVVIYFVMGVAL